MKNKSFLISAFMLILFTSFPQNVFAGRSTVWNNSPTYRWIESEITAEPDLRNGIVEFHFHGKMKFVKHTVNKNYFAVNIPNDYVEKIEILSPEIKNISCNLLCGYPVLFIYLEKYHKPGESVEIDFKYTQDYICSYNAEMNQVEYIWDYEKKTSASAFRWKKTDGIADYTRKHAEEKDGYIVWKNCPKKDGRFIIKYDASKINYNPECEYINIIDSSWKMDLFVFGGIVLLFILIYGMIFISGMKGNKKNKVTF